MGRHYRRVMKYLLHYIDILVVITTIDFHRIDVPVITSSRVLVHLAMVDTCRTVEPGVSWFS